MEEKPVIKVKDLTRNFGNFIAVNNVSFEVQRREIFGFLGANGAGKTTVIKLLTGLLKPSSGIAVVNNYDVYKHSEQIKKQIGYMSQKFSLYEDLTVKENIELFGGIYGLSLKKIRERMEEILGRLELIHEKNTLIKQLPAGWRQKLAFSVAIIHEPVIVYLDEPTSGVDPLTSRQFWNLIYDVSQKGITIFLTTHNMEEAEYCDRVGIMVDGKLVECDTPAALKSKYASSDMDKVFLKIVKSNRL